MSACSKWEIAGARVVVENGVLWVIEAETKKQLFDAPIDPVVFLVRTKAGIDSVHRTAQEADERMHELFGAYVEVFKVRP